MSEETLRLNSIKPESFISRSKPADISKWREEYKIEDRKAKCGSRANRDEHDKSGNDVKSKCERMDCKFLNGFIDLRLM